MRKIVLASHGYLASGMKSTVEMIAGRQDNLLAYDSYVDNNYNVEEFFNILANSGDEVIIITDLLGGSVNNEALKYANFKNIYIIAGMNVSLVLNLVLKISNDIEKDINESIEESKNMILFARREIDMEEEDF
ncbi:PTS sugar transporter subunit IIA [Clostridium nigeriense]|uniref:PTS sugar transporter subunit IIA n=1 Tax=Clostridium nigeriense TaxID=1805470 RepID=UPI003D34931A